MSPRLPVAAFCLCTFALSAQAAPLTALEVLQQFNLVTLGDASTSSHTDGRAYIGGSLAGNGAVFEMHPGTTPDSSYAGLTVAGPNASGFQVTAGGLTALGNVSNSTVNNGAAAIAGNASNSSFNGSGGAYVGGGSSGLNMNSGSLGAAAAAAMFATASATDFASTLANASSALAGLASTGSWWDVSGNRVTFHAVADAGGRAVFDLSAADDLLFSLGEFDFDLGGASSVIFNADLGSASINANFLGGSAQALASKLIWNFYDATSLTLGSQFGGSILATGAALTNYNNIEGGVYVDTLAQYGEIHQGAYGGNLPPGRLPEPASLALAGIGLAATFAVRRRAA